MAKILCVSKVTKYLQNKEKYTWSNSLFINCFIRYINISGVTDYTYLATTCSDESYYECLAKRFQRILSKKDFSSEKFNGSHCSFRDICSPFTLPFGEKRVPLCINDSVRHCYEEIIIQLEADQDVYCKKSWNIKEFKAEDFKSGHETDKTGLRFQFVLPQTTKDHMSKKPFKIIKKEYLIMNEMSLVGNIGGTLGMFVGFSFIGTIEWLMDILSKFKNHVKQTDM